MSNHPAHAVEHLARVYWLAMRMTANESGDTTH
jgi:hypothetical protein